MKIRCIVTALGRVETRTSSSDSSTVTSAAAELDSQR
jgi:hypothetical protein